MEADFKNDKFVSWLMENAWSQAHEVKDCGGSDELVSIAACCKRILIGRKRAIQQLKALEEYSKRK